MTKSAVIAALGALAQETRLDVFRLLVERGPEGMPAGEIGDRLKLPSPTLSFHLNQLRYAGLITSRRESRSIIYRANFNAMNGLMAYLTEKCCGGRPELCSSAAFPAAACAPGSCAPGACEPAGEQLVPLRKPDARAKGTAQRKARRSERGS
jgi:ArsR family transcriptional regulator